MSTLTYTPWHDRRLAKVPSSGFIGASECVWSERVHSVRCRDAGRRRTIKTRCASRSFARAVSVALGEFLRCRFAFSSMTFHYLRLTHDFKNPLQARRRPFKRTRICTYMASAMSNRISPATPQRALSLINIQIY